MWERTWYGVFGQRSRLGESHWYFRLPLSLSFCFILFFFRLVAHASTQANVQTRFPPQPVLWFEKLKLHRTVSKVRRGHSPRLVLFLPLVPSQDVIPRSGRNERDMEKKRAEEEKKARFISWVVLSRHCCLAPVSPLGPSATTRAEVKAWKTRLLGINVAWHTSRAGSTGLRGT